MNCYTSIPVFELIGASVHTREAADSLLQAAENHPCNEVDLDFLGVEFISRSFADQFHSDKLKLAEKLNKIIIVTNANDNVISMLQSVAKTQNRGVMHYSKIPVYKITDARSLAKLLLSF